MTKNIEEFTIQDFFTHKEITLSRGMSIDEIQVQLVLPNMEKINSLTGQHNDSRYFAYLLQHYGKVLRP